MPRDCTLLPPCQPSLGEKRLRRAPWTPIKDRSSHAASHAARLHPPPPPPHRKGKWSSTAVLQKHFGLTKVDRIDIEKFKAAFAAGKQQVSPNTRWTPTPSSKTTVCCMQGRLKKNKWWAYPVPPKMMLGSGKQTRHGSRGGSNPGGQAWVSCSTAGLASAGVASAGLTA